MDYVDDLKISNAPMKVEFCRQPPQSQTETGAYTEHHLNPNPSHNGAKSSHVVEKLMKRYNTIDYNKLRQLITNSGVIVDGSPKVTQPPKTLLVSLIVQTFTNLDSCLYIFKFENAPEDSEMSEGKHYLQSAIGTLKREPMDQYNDRMRKLQPDNYTGSDFIKKRLKQPQNKSSFNISAAKLREELKYFRFGIGTTDQRYRIEYRDDEDTKREEEMIRKGFYYNKVGDAEKERSVIEEIEKKKKLYKMYGVKRIKYIGEKFLNEEDAEETNEEELVKALETRRKKKEEEEKQEKFDDEIEKRKGILEVMESGREVMLKKLKKSSKRSMNVNMLIMSSMIYVLLMMILITVEVINQYRRSSEVVRIGRLVASANEMFNNLGLLNILLLVDDAAHYNATVSVLRSEKNNIMQNIDVKSILEVPLYDIQANNMSKYYSFSNIIELVIGSALQLSNSMSNDNDLQALNMSNSAYFYMVQNTVNTLLPNLPSITQNLFNYYSNVIGIDSMAIYIGGVILCFSIFVGIVLIYLTHKSDQELFELLGIFVQIPSGKSKLYHTQTEQFLLLFMEQEDKHVDDLKTEVSSMKKPKEEEGRGDGRKKKRFLKRRLITMKSVMIVLSLILAPLVYYSGVIYLLVYQSQLIQYYISFGQSEKTRSTNYVYSLLGLHTAVRYPNVNINSTSGTNYVLAQTSQNYATDAQIDSNSFQLSINEYFNKLTSMNAPNNLCNFTSEAPLCKQYVQEYNQLVGSLG